MNAFVPSLAARRPATASLSSRAAICTPHRPGTANVRPAVMPPRAATPFFGSSAFGASVPAHVARPAPRAGVRMDVTVVVGDNEPVEAALRRFKKDVTRSGHLFELRRRRYFETNTEKRIRKAAAARRKARMAVRASNNNRNSGMQSNTGNNSNNNSNSNSGGNASSAGNSGLASGSLNKPQTN